MIGRLDIPSGCASMLARGCLTLARACSIFSGMEGKTPVADAFEQLHPLMQGSGCGQAVVGHRRSRLLVASGMILCLASTAVYAQPEASATAPKADKPAQVNAEKDALRIYIDPVTGKRTMPPPAAKESKPASKSLTPPPQRKEYNLGPGKGHAIDMRGHLHEMRAIVGKHGRIRWHCDQGAVAHPANGDRPSQEHGDN